MRDPGTSGDTTLNELVNHRLYDTKQRPLQLLDKKTTNFD